MKTNIVIPSWVLVSSATKIKKFNFFPSFISTLYLSVIVIYQVSYTYIILFQKKSEFFSLVIDFAHKGYLMQIIVTLAIGFIFYMLLSPIAEGGVICLIDAFRKKDEKKYTIPYGVSQGLLGFLPLFEFHNFMGLFRFLTILTFYFLTIRVLGSEYLGQISIFFSIYLVLAVIVNMLFVYAKFFIIFDGKGVFEAINESIKMTLMNMHVTGKLYFTLFLVYARVILTVVFIILFALIFSLIFAYIYGWYFAITAIIAGIIALAFILFMSHLNSVLEIFVEALWYSAFVDNRGESSSQEEL